MSSRFRSVFFYSATTGAPVTGLNVTTLQTAMLYKDRTGANVVPKPTIVELGLGGYGFTASAGDETTGVVALLDGGATVGSGTRYQAVWVAADELIAWVYVDASEVLWTGSAPTVGLYVGPTASALTPQPTLTAIAGAYLYATTIAPADVATGCVLELAAAAGAYPAVLTATIEAAYGSGVTPPPPPPVIGTTLLVNGISAGAIMLAASDPKADVRDIGGEAQGSDGSMRVTRQTRKRDLKWVSPPMSAADAYAWECLLTGEGEVWSFDSTLYGSKGGPPTANVGCTISSMASKFGVAKLVVPATTGTITYFVANSFGDTSAWTVEVWRSTDSGVTWTNYIVRSDGAKWVAGVRNDAAVTTWLTVSAGSVTLANTTGADVHYDDLTVLPFLVPTAWPPQLGVATVAFPPLPYVDLTGDLVQEQAARRVLGTVASSSIKVAGAARRKLDVDMKAK